MTRVNVSSTHSRILLVTRNFPPLIGGMERLIHDLYRCAAQRHEVALIGPAGCGAFAPEARMIAETPIRPLAWFLIKSLIDTRRLAGRFSPRIVIAGSGLLARAALAGAGRASAATACYVHGLDLVYSDPIYQRVFVPALRRMDLVLVNSANTASLARDAGINPACIEVLSPPVDVPTTLPDPLPFVSRHELADRRVILSVGRLTPRKGLLAFTRQVMPELIRRLPETCLVVIGDDPTEAARPGRGQRAALEATAAELGLSDHVRVLGRVDDDTLALAYAASELAILPVVKTSGDVEGFGIVAIEAAAYGLPTVAFASGGVPDAVADGRSGYLVAPGDYRQLMEQIVGHLEHGSPSVTRESCQSFAGEFSTEKFGRRLFEVCAALTG
jgi:phosphatidylinositol alpha-1,6-mannosyltransferase